MRSTSPCRTIVTVVSLAALCAGQVMAAPPEDSGDAAADQTSSHADAALAAFQDGRYDEAVAHFEAAFEADQNPNNLFNIGRVYEEAGQLESAVAYYKRFIAQPGVSLDNRKIALERIDVLEQIIAKTKPVEAPAQPQQAPPPIVEADPISPLDTTAEVEHERRRRQRIGGYVLLGVGAAGLIVGGVTGGLALDVEAKLADSDDPAERVKLVNRGDTMALAADGLYIAGGTLALVGLIVTLTALPRRGDRRTAVAPMFDGGGGGVVVMRRF